MAERTEETPRVEVRPLPWRRLTGLALGFVVLVSVSVSGLFLIYGSPGGRLGDAAPEPAAPEPAAPQPAATERFTAQRAHRLRFEAAEAEALSTLGWADREAGLARIPVEAAMRMIAEQGLPRWPAPEADGLRDLAPRLPRGAGPPAPAAAPEAGR